MLAGDTKQLDAVVKSKVARDYGFGTSFMEHLMTKNIYADSPEYNRSFIVQLVKNYRSHPSILFVPNRLFYKNRLEAVASKGELDT